MKRRSFLYSQIVLLSCFILLFSLSSESSAANRGRSVPAGQLPNELKRTDIKDYYAGSGAKQIGSIQTVIGHVVVARENMRSAYHAAPGDRLFEKDVIFTLKGSKCRFKLTGEDVVTMGENTRIGVKSFNENPRRSTKSSVFTMAKGKAMFYALRLFKHRSNAMVVETPTAVSGVRGTKWGVDVVELEGTGTASLPQPIQLADNSNIGLRILAQANPPSLPQFQTTILCFSGTVFTGSTAPPPPGAPPPPVVTLSQGQMTTVGSGQPPAPPSITPPSLANSFTAGTFAPPPGDSGAPPPPPPPPGSTLIPTTGGITAFTTPDTSSLTQQQSQQQTASRPTNHEGFIVGMLTAVTGGPTEYFYGTYQSDTIQNFDAGNATATYSGYPATFSTTSLLKLNQAGCESPSVPQPLQKVESGYNTYLEWGYWTQPVEMTGISDNVRFSNKGYYVWGDKTTSLPSSFSGTYTGDAYGTLWSNAGGSVDLAKGTVSMNVTYSGGVGSISAFNLTVGGNYGISNGSTSSPFGTCGNYTVTGTSMINGSAGGTAYVNGNFFGPDAKWTGGVWRATDGSSKYLNGNYVASKP